MLRKLTTPLFMTLFALMSFSAQAGIEKGDKTISIFGSLTSDDYSDTLIALAAGGYFFTDTLELQGTVLLVSSDSGGSVSSLTGFGANANLYLPGQNPDIVPYVGAGAQLILTDFSGTTDSEIGFNAQAGIKQFLSENVTVNYQGQFITSSGYDATVLSVGFSIFFE